MTAGFLWLCPVLGWNCFGPGQSRSGLFVLARGAGSLYALGQCLQKVIRLIIDRTESLLARADDIGSLVDQALLEVIYQFTGFFGVLNGGPVIASVEPVGDGRTGRLMPSGAGLPGPVKDLKLLLLVSADSVGRDNDAQPLIGA